LLVALSDTRGEEPRRDGKGCGMASQEPVREGTIIIKWKRPDSGEPESNSFD
jgi:hypothetical protein